jgi:hypothetical protein
MEKIRIVSMNPFAGREHIIFCQGTGPDDPNCLEKILPPENK